MKHCEIVMEQRANYGPGDWASGSWFVEPGPLGRSSTAHIDLPGYYAGGGVGILTHDQCLVAAIKRAQELGYESFSITTKPHADYEEKGGDDYGATADDLDVLIERLDKMQQDMDENLSLIRKALLDDESQLIHLDKTIDKVSERVDSQNATSSRMLANIRLLDGRVEHLERRIVAMEERLDKYGICND